VLLDAALRAVDTWYELGVEWIDRAGARFLRDRARPHVYDANHVRRPRNPVDVPALLAAADEIFVGCDHRAVRLDPRSPGAELEAALLLGGYACELQILMALEGPLRGRPGTVRIAPAADERAWQAFTRLKQTEFDADGLRLPAEAWCGHLRAKTPPVVTWLADLDGEPVGFFSELVGGEVAVLEDLYVRPDARQRGVGTALVAQAVAHARLRGAGACCLAARADDTPKEMYARMGFRPIGVTRSLLRTGLSARGAGRS
jgi:GNAT superfamily N-acetyltransferase